MSATTLPATSNVQATDAGQGQAQSTSQSDVQGNFPASWYTEPAFYEFELRAIFSKHWLLTTHRIRLPQPGSFVRYQLGDFDFFLTKDREDKIHAFHNVCRHRAYPIIEDKDGRDGKKQILSCGYHG